MCYNPNCPQVQMPSVLPLTQALEKAIVGEATATKFYQLLAAMAPDQDQRDRIIKISQDEWRHHNNYQATYCAVTGHVFQHPEPNPAPPATYRQGLQEAFEDEQTDYETYRNLYFAYSHPMVKHAFMDGFLDEARHARWYNNFLIRND